MAAPVFEEFDPAKDCDCPGCAHWRRVLPYSRTVRHPAARHHSWPRPGGGTRTAVIVAAAASTALGAGQVAPALAAPQTPPAPGVPAGDGHRSPQGHQAPLYGRGGESARHAEVHRAPATTRAEIINRAKVWVDAQVPYSMTDYWSDGYRQDCSGYVSMAWGLPRNEWTGSLGQYGKQVSKEELQPGDILLFHNPQNPEKGSHVVIFGGWTDYTHSSYIAYEQTPPHTRRQATPYAYWSNSDRYVPYRYNGLAPDPGEAKPGAPAAVSTRTPYPGAAYFGPGANNKYVTRLGEMLVAHGAGRFYTSGPGPRWSEADRRATEAFQLAQGWQGVAADGLPGPRTWELLTSGTGRPVPAAGKAGPAAPASHEVPGYPGRAMFRPGAVGEHVTRLGEQLVKKGFGTYYTTGPGPRWGEADRRNVEAFQRSQGWRGGAADGFPGPETWRRLFS